MYKLSILLVLLVASVGDVLGVCTGTSKTFAPGELKLSGKKGDCENKESVSGILECTGNCDSSTKITFVPGKKPSFEGNCNCCKLDASEKTEVKLSCTLKDGSKKDVTKKLKIPTSCDCGACKKGKKGGKGGKPGKN